MVLAAQRGLEHPSNIPSELVQGIPNVTLLTASTLKHWVGYGFPSNGQDRGPSYV